MHPFTKLQAQAIHGLLVAFGGVARSDVTIEYDDVSVSLVMSGAIIIQTNEGSAWHESIQSFARSYQLDSQ